MKKKNIVILGVASLAAIASTAFLIWRKKKRVKDGEIPSSHAPQLDLQNPGDQSEFPAAASGEKDLG